MLRPDLCDYSDAYIVANVIISVTRTNANNKRNKKLALKMLCLEKKKKKSVTH